MKKPRSYAVFIDGHDEDILYREIEHNGTYLFATKSGIYKFCSERICWDRNGFSVCAPPHFERVTSNESFPIVYIKSVHIDERKVYQYRIENLHTVIQGNILVPPKATDADIRKLIIENLKVEYEEVK